MTDTSKPDQSGARIHYDFRGMLPTGRMALELGVDRKTLRSWAKKGLIPSFVNPANGYRFFDKREVLNALRLGLPLAGPGG